MSELFKKYEANIWKIFVLYALAGLSYFFIPVIIFYYQHYNISFFQIGMLSGAGLLTTLLFEVPTGAFADLYGRKKSISIGLLCNLISVTLFTFTSSFFPFLISSIAMGLGGAFISGAWEAFLFDSLKYIKRETEYLKLITKQEMTFMVVLMISSLSSPFLFTINVKFPFYIGTFFSIFLWLFTFRLFELPIKKHKKNLLQKHINQMKDAFYYIRKHPKITWFILFGTLGLVIQRLFRELIDAPYTISKGFTIPQYGVVGFFSIIIIMLLMNSSHKLEKKHSEKNSLFFIFFFMILFMGLMYFFNLYLFVIFAAMFSGLSSIKNLFLSNYINHHLRKKVRATVISIFSMFASFIGVIFLLITGKLIDLLSISKIVLLLIILNATIGSILLFVRYNKKIWKKFS